MSRPIFSRGNLRAPRRHFPMTKARELEAEREADANVAFADTLESVLGIGSLGCIWCGGDHKDNDCPKRYGANKPSGPATATAQQNQVSDRAQKNREAKVERFVAHFRRHNYSADLVSKMSDFDWKVVSQTMREARVPRELTRQMIIERLSEKVA